ncbi:GntR family transcriptional regulator [Kaistia terrae]|uniref:GntR family transcriptional regulator n=1 Tax=Kaistia terrae TaxID=537017 RepID=A0ABW0Q1Y7_9HYPH|nr:GntR family transcriptional regulator [Kaistia terrae]MCX5581714.1 GntR family transcriptional regulator [Kaistia terrae]
MTTIERPLDGNLREQVLQQVRAEIISGQSAPGAMYSVPSLAATLGVSTTPVREALLELARSGLIEPLRNRGFKVVTPTLTQLRNLFDMREMLEVKAAEIVALKRKKDLDGVRKIADEIADAVEVGTVAGYLEADRRFHQAFAEITDNELLAETIMAFRDKMRLYGIGTDQGIERQRDSVREHYQILELADLGDVEGLGALMRHHIRSWEPIFTEALLEAVRSQASEAGGNLSLGPR